MPEASLTSGDLRAWKAPVRDLLLFLVNQRGIKCRMIDGTHLLLYPPDGESRPFKAAAERPVEASIEYLRNQFMATFGISDKDGVVPGAREVEVDPEPTEAPAALEDGAHAALRTLAASLGIDLGGVSEAMALRLEVERLNGMVTSLQKELADKDEEMQVLQEHCNGQATLAAELQRVLDNVRAAVKVE